MKTVRLSDAKQRLSELIRDADRGEHVVITIRGKPSVELYSLRSRGVHAVNELLHNNVRLGMSIADALAKGRE